MAAANYEPYEMSKPKPGRLLFRGNGHGTVVITISEADTGRELVSASKTHRGNRVPAVPFGNLKHSGNQQCYHARS